MLVLGPSIVERGLNPSTSLLANDSMCMLGPATGGTPDPITRLFILTGKLLYMRRIFEAEAGDQPAAIQAWTTANNASIDQVIAAEPGDSEWEIVWTPHFETTQDQTATLETMPGNVDRVVIKVLENETARVLGIDPSLPTSQKVESIITYMRDHRLALQDATGGLRDYLTHMFTDTKGKSTEWPTSPSPTFADSLVTPYVVPESTGAQTWIMVL